jgi:hypothetical protein
MTLKPVLWLAVPVLASVLFSLALGCGAPFAAIAALGALALARRDAYLAGFFAWVANQAVGFGFLGYPTDPRTLAWGVAIGLSALSAVWAARWIAARLGGASWPTIGVAALAAALIAQQVIILASAQVLGFHPAAFAPSVLFDIAWTNAAAFVLLVAVQMAGAQVNVTRAPGQSVQA